MSLNEELRYKYALDITRAFSSEEHIKKFLNFFMDEATSFANEIDKNGNQIPYPIIYSDKGFVYQTDYNFLIHCIAKYFASINVSIDIYLSILNIFGIRTGKNDKNVFKQRRRAYLIFLLEYVTGLFSCNNQNNKTTSIQNSTAILYEFKGNYFQYKVISMLGTFNTTSNLFGIPLYIGEEKWVAFRERFKHNFDENNMKQVAFLQRNIDTFLKENDVKKFNYFVINTVQIKESNRYIKYDEISRINYLEDLIRIDIQKIATQEHSEDDED
ncbi:hypothetical protein [Aliarcobacter thereius]|uniref:Uncharacterized protein n=1 Tax=Aliarcobacter thereius LMG 24486 TaxID=1032240 RepID=A0A1C7WR24_9BACT|nr:hypothetical protein [Aliarcobacter thereius]OCL95733.1 hypothetical protein AA347_01213 [Aliarcobacter thereius LMG 24486]QBF16288.1 hypothetical protein ATH_1238 [Aliarcobacter thereius LMG 24486]TLS92091.1 hypothetical protein FE244_06710 [Aliarcobacter thereius]